MKAARLDRDKALRNLNAGFEHRLSELRREFETKRRELWQDYDSRVRASMDGWSRRASEDAERQSA